MEDYTSEVQTPTHNGITSNNSSSESSSKTVVALSSMLEGAKLMREQDAELLESMRFTDSCSSGSTPTLQPTKSPSLSDIPALTEMSENSAPSSSTASRVMASPTNRRDSSKLKSSVLVAQQRFERSSSNKRSMEESSNEAAIGGEFSDDDPLLTEHCLIPEASSSIQREALHLLSQQSLEREHSGISYRQCLSGEVRLAVEEDENDENNNASDNLDDRTMGEEAAAASPVSVAQEVERCAERVEARIVRSKSMDRRMCEAYQFAEAVGEIIPSLNQTIIEEGGSDDDDDDGNAKEIRLDESPAAVVAACRRQDVAERVVAVHHAHGLGAVGDVTPSVVVGKTRPQWPFPSGTGRSTFLFQLPDGVSPPDFVYKGICANPPEITTHGISRGNYAQLHRKAWLEVSDKYHRYGKNLRLYYRYWEALGFPTNSFFDWLDSKGEAAGQPLPNLDECPRSQLDSDTVLYITNPDVTQGYSLNIVPDGQGRGLVLDVDGEKVKTGSEGWIFVLRDNVMYGALKITSISGHSKQRFHHSSFFGGKAVAAAGIIFTDDDGFLIRLYPHSGHYRPGEAHIQRMLFFLHHKGVDLRTFEMDTQQILHVARDNDIGNNDNNNDNKGDNKAKKKKKCAGGSEKKKKIQSLHLKPAVYVACFLAHKARFIGAGIFTTVHKIRKADVTTVSEALIAVDEGGHWKKALKSEN